MNNGEKLEALIIIINAGFSEEAMEIARDCGARGGTIINARGSGIYMQSVLGMHVEPEKEMIISIVPSAVAEEIMQKIKNNSGLGTAANGICFCMPVDRMTMINKI